MKRGSFGLKGNRKDLKLMTEILATPDIASIIDKNKNISKYFYCWKEDRFGIFIFPKEKYFKSYYYSQASVAYEEKNYPVAVLKYGAVNGIYVSSINFEKSKK